MANNFISLILEISLTSWIALYGAILATATLVWNILRELKDKPKLKIKYHTGLITGMGSDMPPVFSINLANSGKRKIIISSIGMYINKNKVMHFLPHNMVLDSTLPIEISPHDSKDLYLNITHIDKAIKEHGIPKYIWARDKLGKEYHGSTRYISGHVSAIIKSCGDNKI